MEAIKKVLTALLLFSAVAANAQKIIFDKVNVDGIRRIETSMHKFSHWTSSTDVSVGLEAKERAGETAYRLCVALKGKEKIRIDNYMRMLLKTNKGNVMELSCSQGATDATGELYDAVSNISEYDVKVYYDISDKQIDKIKTEGLERMRVETYDRDINVKFSEARDASAYILRSYSLINDRIKERNSFSDGF